MIYDSQRVSNGRNHRYLLSNLDGDLEAEVSKFSNLARNQKRGDFIAVSREIQQEQRGQYRTAKEYLILARVKGQKNVKELENQLEGVLSALPAPDPPDDAKTKGLMIEYSTLIELEKQIISHLNSNRRSRSKFFFLIFVVLILGAIISAVLISPSDQKNQSPTDEKSEAAKDVKQSSWSKVKDDNDAEFKIFLEWTSFPKEGYDDPKNAEEWAGKIISKLDPQKKNNSASEGLEAFKANDFVKFICDEIAKTKDEGGPDLAKISNEYLGQLKKLDATSTTLNYTPEDVDNFIKNIESLKKLDDPYGYRKKHEIADEPKVSFYTYEDLRGFINWQKED